MHGTNLDNMQSYKRIQLLHEIKGLYENKNNMLASDRDICRIPFESITQTHTVAQLSLFLDANKKIIKQSTKEAKILGKRFKKITQYFPRLYNQNKQTNTDYPETDESATDEPETITTDTIADTVDNTASPETVLDDDQPFILQDQRFSPATLRSYRTWHKFQFNPKRDHSIPQRPETNIKITDLPRTILPWFLRPPEPGP